MASYSDDFDRADGEIGANWIEDEGDIDIVSNRAECQSAVWYNRARYVSALDSVDHYSEAYVKPITGTTPDGGPACRIEDADPTHYAGWYVQVNDPTGFRLVRLVADGWTELDTAASNATSERKIKVQADGATQAMYVDDVEICTGTDGVITAGVYSGIAGNQARASFNNWSAADLTGTTYEEILTSLAISASTIVALQTFVNIVSDQIQSASSLTEAQTYIENILSLLESVSVVEAIQTYLATLNSVAQSVSSLTDLQTYVQTLQSVAASSSSIQDFIGYVEIVQSIIISSASIIDTIALVEILLSTITSAASIADVQSYFEGLLSTLISLSSVTDKQIYIHNLQTLIQSHVSIIDQQSYIHQLQDLIVSSASVTDILSSPFAENLLSTILSQAGVYDYYKKPTMAETAIRFYMRPRQDFEFAKISPALILPVALGEGGLGLGPLGEGYIKCTGFRMAPHPANFIIQKKGAA